MAIDAFVSSLTAKRGSDSAVLVKLQLLTKKRRKYFYSYSLLKFLILACCTLFEWQVKIYNPTFQIFFQKNSCIIFQICIEFI